MGAGVGGGGAAGWEGKLWARAVSQLHVFMNGQCVNQHRKETFPGAVHFWKGKTINALGLCFLGL